MAVGFRLQIDTFAWHFIVGHWSTYWASAPEAESRTETQTLAAYMCPLSSAPLLSNRASLHSVTHPARLLHLLLGLLLIAIPAEMHTFDLGPVSLPIQRLLIPPCILSAQPWDVRGIKQFARSLFPALLRSIPQQNKKPISLRSKSSQSTFSSKRLRTAPRALPASHLTSQHSLRTVSGLYSSHSSNTRQGGPT